MGKKIIEIKAKSGTMKNVPLLVLFILIVSCTKQLSRMEQALILTGENRLEQVLILAGENRSELEKVLDHYKRDDQDSLKYKAAVFLIENMPGSFSSDNKQLAIYEPFYKQCSDLDSIFAGDLTIDRRMLIDSLWTKFVSKTHTANKYIQDIKYIKSDIIISEIDLSFKAWNNNLYTKNGSFNDFCEYILPYNRYNGLIIDSARFVFFDRHSDIFFSNTGENFIDETDSLLYLYRHIEYSQFNGMSIPILNANSLEILKNGLCEHRCWFNSLMLSSLGMPAAMDFVPGWGNKNGIHAWNVIIIDGISYAFEPFWDDDRWKYKSIYNNITSDSIWGKFRLPKVYRSTYSINIDGPLTDKRVNYGDIPQLFRNIKKKDVSDEYFNTIDVTIEFAESVPKNCYYSYLCVFNKNSWIPVQWGEIKDNKAEFKAMGSDIVYMPVFIYKGRTLYATSPFLLKENGEKEFFETKDLNNRVAVKLLSGVYRHNNNLQNFGLMSGTIITGSMSQDFSDCDTICILPECKDYYSNEINVTNNKAYQFIRVFLPKDTLALHDLSFFEKTPSGIQKISKLSFSSKPDDISANGEYPELIFDDYKSTGFKSTKPLPYVDIDLGKPSEIIRLEFTPYIDSEFDEDIAFQLLFWKNGWQLVGELNGSNKHLIFENVPENGLFKVFTKGNSTSRIFTYKNNEVIWH